jgi:hypothetical protein
MVGMSERNFDEKVGGDLARRDVVQALNHK